MNGTSFFFVYLQLQKVTLSPSLAAYLRYLHCPSLPTIRSHQRVSLQRLWLLRQTAQKKELSELCQVYDLNLLTQKTKTRLCSLGFTHTGIFCRTSITDVQLSIGLLCRWTLSLLALVAYMMMMMMALGSILLTTSYGLTVAQRPDMRHGGGCRPCWGVSCGRGTVGFSRMGVCMGVRGPGRTRVGRLQRPGPPPASYAAQGRRHGFESGGIKNCASGASEQNIFSTPPLFVLVRGTKCLLLRKVLQLQVGHYGSY